MARYLNILTGLLAPDKIRQFEVHSGVKSAMEPPHFLIIDGDVEKPDTGIFLYRFRSNGDCVGDTWHKSIEEAKEQAAFEYENLLQKWQEIPPSVDSVSFGLARLPPPSISADIKLSSEDVLSLQKRLQLHLEYDGSLLDVYVDHTSIETWQIFIDWLREGKYRVEYHFGKDKTPLPKRAEILFKNRKTDRSMISIFIDGMQLNCHCFRDEDIELDAHPLEISAENSFATFLEFLQELSSKFMRYVLLTHENVKDLPFLIIKPPATSAENKH